MNLHTFIKGPIHHLTRFYLTEVIFHWVPSQKIPDIHRLLWYLHSSRGCVCQQVWACIRTQSLLRLSSYQLNQSLSGESWNAPGNDPAMRIWGLSTVTSHFFLHPPSHTLLQSWDQFHSSADSPVLLKLPHWQNHQFFQLSLSYKWFARKACEYADLWPGI